MLRRRELWKRLGRPGMVMTVLFVTVVGPASPTLVMTTTKGPRDHTYTLSSTYRSSTLGYFHTCVRVSAHTGRTGRTGRCQRMRAGDEAGRAQPAVLLWSGVIKVEAGVKVEVC